ncbi:MAG: phosphatidate cytidylyltransferase [Bacteroidia bacterium]|nr:phosphatidate cytidylyltransferase [Bacteroidia bacterium]MDW8348129.1 phosphatidate cytidylyltransferase [Bacteroidia bacterium]
MSNLTLRVLTGLLGGTVFILLLTAHIYSYYFLWVVIGIVCVWEWKRMFFLPCFLWLYMVICIFLIVTSANESIFHCQHYQILFIFYSALMLLFADKVRHEQMLHTLLGVIYLSVPMSVVFFLSKSNPFYFRTLFVVLVVWVSDISAYFVGKYLGKHLLFSRISPKKTVEGLIGSFIFCGIAIFCAFMFGLVKEVKYLWIGVITAICTPIGDLLESALKRKANVKDSSQILPGHGGFLDRFDGFFFAIVAQSWI